jgi:hypothetical protein
LTVFDPPYQNLTSKHPLCPASQAAYLLAALAKGTYVTVPESLMVGKRLECVQEAMDMNMKRASDSEEVVTL